MADVTITQATVSHALSATTPDNPAAEIQPQHWNSAHAASFVLAAAVASALFSNANGMSFGLSDSAITGSYTVPVQSVQTQASGNIAGAGFTSTTTAGVDVKATQNSAGLSMAVPAYITTADPVGAAAAAYAAAAGDLAAHEGAANPHPQYLTTARASNDAVGLATALTANGVAWTVNSAGLSLNVPAYLTTAGRSQDSSLYAGTGFTSATTAGTEIKATVNTAGVSMAVPAYLTAAAGGGAGTGFTTTTIANAVVAGTLNSDGLLLAVPAYLTTAQAPGAYLTTARASTDAVGLNTALTANGVSWTVNSSGISLNVPAYLTTAAQSGHSHGNPTLALTNLSGTTASASNGFTLSLSAAAPGGGADKTISFVEIADGGRFTTCAVWNNATYSRRPIFVPFQAEHVLASCNTIRIFASRSSGTVLQATFMAGIYTRANSTSMNLLSSTSFGVSLTTSAQFSGVRMYDFTGLSGLSLSPGGYVLGLLASVAASNSIGLQIMGGDNMALAGFVVSSNVTAATHSQSAILPFWGVFNATSGALPSAVAMSSISGGNGVNSPDIYGIIKAI